MHWDRIEAQWQRFRVAAKVRWHKLSERQLELIGGRRELLARRIQDAYGVSPDEAERQLNDWQAGLGSGGDATVGD